MGVSCTGLAGERDDRPGDHRGVPATRRSRCAGLHCVLGGDRPLIDPRIAGHRRPPCTLIPTRHPRGATRMQSGYVTVDDGLEMYYEVHGEDESAEGVPLVLIP